MALQTGVQHEASAEMRWCVRTDEVVVEVEVEDVVDVDVLVAVEVVVAELTLLLELVLVDVLELVLRLVVLVVDELCEQEAAQAERSATVLPQSQRVDKLARASSKVLRHPQPVDEEKTVVECYPPTQRPPAQRTVAGLADRTLPAHEKQPRTAPFTEWCCRRL